MWFFVLLLILETMILVQEGWFSRATRRGLCGGAREIATVRFVANSLSTVPFLQ